MSSIRERKEEEDERETYGDGLGESIHRFVFPQLSASQDVSNHFRYYLRRGAPIEGSRGGRTTLSVKSRQRNRRTC